MITDQAKLPHLDRWFLGTRLRVVIGGDDTGGALAVLEQRAPHGFSPPLHVHHREDTALLVLAGQLTVQTGDQTNTCAEGGFAWLPRDVPHTFRVDSDEAHLLELITPAGFEQFHLDASDPARSQQMPPRAEPDIPRIVQAIEPYDAEIIGPSMGH
jgi:quercetin dioxygenase-like cupin family protein